MLLGDIRLTADDHVQLLDVDGSIQATLTVGDALALSHRLILMQDLLRYRYGLQLDKDSAKAKELEAEAKQAEAARRYNAEMDARDHIIAESVEKPWLPLHDGE